MHKSVTECLIRRQRQQLVEYEPAVVQDSGAMAWSDQAIARLSPTWMDTFLFRHRIRRQVFHGIMALSFVLTAVMFGLSVTRFPEYTPDTVRAPKIVSIDVWKAYCLANKWSKACQPRS